MAISWSNWAKQKVANATGAQEPIYGPKALHSVAKQAKTVSFTPTSKLDLRWITPQFTSVETQTFYLTADSGHIAMVQVIYSNILNINVVCQFSTKVFHPNSSPPPLWASDTLNKHWFDDNKYSFFSDKCELQLSSDGSSYHIRSSVSPKATVDVTVSRLAPGFMIGCNGTTNYGFDSDKPWGFIRHAFWPRCSVQGTIVTRDESIDFTGKGLFVHALQGMKPHHAAAKWNFVTVTGPTHSAMMMEFVTTPSYGSTKVNVGAISTDTEIIIAGTDNSVTFTETETDPETKWNPPSEILYKWAGKNVQNTSITASIGGPLGKRLDRVDILNEVPKFIKNIMGGVAGVFPFIYQYTNRLPLKVCDGTDSPKTEEAVLFCEATFISCDERVSRSRIGSASGGKLTRLVPRPLTNAGTNERGLASNDNESDREQSNEAATEEPSPSTSPTGALKARFVGKQRRRMRIRSRVVGALTGGNAAAGQEEENGGGAVALPVAATAAAVQQ